MAYLEILQKHNTDLGGLIEKANSLPEKGDLWKQLDALIEGTLTEVSSGATSIGYYALYSRTKLASVNFPNATSINNYAFEGCSALETADFSNVTSILSYVFNKCYSLKSVILRSETLCKLTSKNSFDRCYHILGTVNSTYNPNGDKDGYFYVPRALVESYKTATNWSTYSTQFRALEDYTVDGTTTGALDPNKI